MMWSIGVSEVITGARGHITWGLQRCIHYFFVCIRIDGNPVNGPYDKGGFVMSQFDLQRG